MDILSIRPHESTLEIVNDANDKPTGIVLTMCYGSDPRVEAVRNANIKIMRDLESAGVIDTEEEKNKRSKQVIAAMVVGWTWPEGVTLGGIENPEFNPANLKTFMDNDLLYGQIIAKSFKKKDFLSNFENDFA